MVARLDQKLGHRRGQVAMPYGVGHDSTISVEGPAAEEVAERADPARGSGPSVGQPSRRCSVSTSRQNATTGNASTCQALRKNRGVRRRSYSRHHAFARASCQGSSSTQRKLGPLGTASPRGPESPGRRRFGPRAESRSPTRLRTRARPQTSQRLNAAATTRTTTAGAISKSRSNVDLRLSASIAARSHAPPPTIADVEHEEKEDRQLMGRGEPATSDLSVLEMVGQAAM